MSDGVEMHDPITGEVFTDPVLASDGMVYDYSTLVLIANSKGTRLSPFTNKPLRKVVFTHNHLRELLGIPKTKDIVRLIYRDIRFGDNGVMKVSLEFDLKKTVEDPLMESLFKELNLWDKESVTLAFYVLKPASCSGDDCKWVVYGPPPLEQIEDRIKRFARCLSITNAFNQCENLGNAILSVGGKEYCTVEVLMGCERADILFSSN